MTLTLTLSSARGAGHRETRTLSAGTLSIGRAPGNDWVLPDPDRYLSKTHCVISIENGRPVLTDLSTNGVHINGASQPTSRDSRVVLTDGDEFRLGDYSITVAETQDQPASRPAPLAGNADPFAFDPLEDPMERPPGFQHPLPHTSPVRPAEDPFDLADEHRGRSPGLGNDLFRGATPSESWQGPAQPDNVDAPAHAFSAPKPLSPANPADIDFDALIGDLSPGQPERPTAAAPPPQPVRAPSPFDELDDLLSSAPKAVPAKAEDAASAPPASASTQPAADAARLLAAFLAGAGVPNLPVAQQDPEAFLRAAGELFRAMVEGLRDVLISRSTVKSEFRVEQTMLRARDNNPLKFSVTAEDTTAALLQPSRPGYKPPLDATREAFADVRSHELALMAGVQTALIALLRRFDPDALEQRL
ncbi:MAG: type VI secretion system-associated FHA domain protein TagH, partial [Acetobacteraceae bacterium]|nr:type VI secretion system-associated FHA domain protein TagH [Acetobacteraceae bacterium]